MSTHGTLESYRSASSISDTPQFVNASYSDDGVNEDVTEPKENDEENEGPSGTL